MHIGTTKCICHKGFIGYSSIVARSNFSVGGQETAPQSLTAHTLDRYASKIRRIGTYLRIYYLWANVYKDEISG